MTISAELAGALRYCGDVRDDRVALPDLWEFYLDSCMLLDADLQISESWRQLTPTPLQIDERVQNLGSVEDFAFEIGIDYRRSGSDDAWRTLDVVAPEKVSDQERIGKRVISFFGQPRKVILSFDPAGYEFQLWYVSSRATQRADQNQISGLPETYAPLRKLLTAHKALPHCGHDAVTHDRLEKVILRELAIWQPRWDRFRNKPLKREADRRLGYKRATRGRRSIRRF